MVKGACLESTGGKVICTLTHEDGAQFAFEISSSPDLKFGKDPKADNTHVDLTLTVRVAGLVTITKQPELL